MKTGAGSITCPFYNNTDQILVNLVKLPEAREVEVHEGDHINPNGSITKDTENPANIKILHRLSP